MKLSGELDYRIRYDVEHNLFHAQNVFNEEYIKPTFIEYVQKLEKENAELKKACDETQELLDKQIEATLKLQQENQELENDYKLIDKSREHLQKENAELSEKLNRHKHDCPNCSAFGKHCPHKVNGDPYTYDCYLTVAELEKENAELKEQLEMSNKVYNGNLDYSHHIEGQLTKAKEIIEKVAKMYRYSPRVDEIIEQAEQFLSEVEK